MITIEIDEEVYRALEKKVKRFGEKPNDVIKRMVFEQSLHPVEGSNAEISAPRTTINHKLIDFVSTPEFARGSSKRRYFDILRFIHTDKPKEFEKLDGLKVGTRVQISKDKSIIQNSGRHTYPQELDGTPYWVLTNLSNDRKKVILEDILRLMQYEDAVVSFVLTAI
jgi:negative modulator of initiation of replication